MEPFVLKEDEYFTIPDWTNAYPDLTVGFTTKKGGVSKYPFESLNLGFHVGDREETVKKNRERLTTLLEFPLLNWVGSEQTHQVHIKKVRKNEKGKGASNYNNSLKNTDGLYTNEEGILLTLCFADCVPIFFFAPRKRMIGIVHAGWKGTVGEICSNMIEAWEYEGISNKEIHVVIGPSICEKCYVVDDYVINYVKNIIDDNDRKIYNEISAGQFNLNLRMLNRVILEKAGIPSSHIQETKLCSCCNEEDFFSHRRDKGKTGRMLSFIGWKEEAK